MHIKTFQVGALPTNCYLVSDKETKACCIIDPGADSAAIIDFIEEHALKPQAVFLTHGHYDHTTDADDLVRKFEIPVYIHKDDATSDTQPDPFRYQSGAETNYYDEGDAFHVGNLLFSVIHTPGHSRGSICLRVDDCLFTGDTLFRDDCGRTDLPGGDYTTLMASLAKIDQLEGIVDVFPGHMDATTLAREQRFNSYLIKAASGGQ